MQNIINAKHTDFHFPIHTIWLTTRNQLMSKRKYQWQGMYRTDNSINYQRNKKIVCAHRWHTHTQRRLKKTFYVKYVYLLDIIVEWVYGNCSNNISFNCAGNPNWSRFHLFYSCVFARFIYEPALRQCWELFFCKLTYPPITFDMFSDA